MAVFSLNQPYPVPGPIPVKFLAAGGDWLRLWCTDAPIGSALRTALDDASARGNADRVQAYDGPIAETWDETFEVGGIYTFQFQEYNYGASTHGGGYTGDPDSWSTETKVGAEQTRYLYVGERLKCRLGSQSYGTAELILWVWNATIRATTVDAHGEKTPAIVASASNQLAHAATLDTTVATKLAALIDKTAATALGNLDALCGDIRGKIPLHFNNNGAVFHMNVAGAPEPDTDNDTAIEQLSASPMTPAGYLQFAQVCRNRLANHMANEPGGSDAAGARIYHQGLAGASISPDYENVLAAIPPGAVNMATARAALADVVRAYEAHRLSAAGRYHNAQDITNPIVVPLAEVDDLHQAFLDALRVQSPTAPTTTNSATTRLVHSAGFQVIPPGIIPPGIRTS